MRRVAGKCPLWAAQVGCGLFILGYLIVLAFQSLTDDDSRSALLHFVSRENNKCICL